MSETLVTRIAHPGVSCGSTLDTMFQFFAASHSFNSQLYISRFDMDLSEEELFEGFIAIIILMVALVMVSSC